MSITSIISTAYKVPRAFVKVSLGVGQRSPGSASMRILLTGNKTSAGTLAVETLVQLFSEGEARTYFGAGSELHLMAKAAFRANAAAEVWAIAITAAGTASTGSIVFGAGAATTAGTVSVWVMGEKITIDVAVGDTVTAIASAVSAAINAKSDWPVTASPSTGTVTVTAKNTGPRGSRISLRTLLEGAATVTHTPVSGYLSGGATLDVPTNALDASAATRFHFIVAPYTTSTELGLYETHVDTQAAPLQGKRGIVVAATHDTLANATTLSDALNAQRMQLLWMEDPDSPPPMLAAAFAATMAGALESDRAYGTDGIVLAGIKPQNSSADIPTASEQNSALNNGLTPLLSVGSEVRVVRSITNYHLDTLGNDDFSVLDVHLVHVADFIADDVEQNFASAWAGFKLAPDSAAGVAPPPRVATPSSVEAWLYQRLKRQEDVLIVNVDAICDESLVVEIDGVAEGRLNAVLPIEPIKLFHQLAVDVQQQS